MHADVELSFEEVKAQAWHCAALRDAGLRGRGRAGLAARPPSAPPRRRRARGRASRSCANTTACRSTARAAVTMSWRRPASAPRSALPRSIEEIGGTAIALGTPGEEGGGGKNIMHREGFFDGIDAMMLVYPGMDNIAHSRTVRCHAGAGRLFRQGRARRGAAGARHQRARRAAAGAERHWLRCASSCRPTCACTGSSPRAARCPRSFPTTSRPC